MQIEKNVPAPKSTRGRTSKYPWDKMQVNDSIAIDDPDQHHNARSSAAQYGARHNKKFVSKVVDGVMRIWRVA